MCGLCGELRFDGRPADLDAVATMTGAMASRGPDGQGAWHEGPVAFGHRRLSVIDLSEAGAQPMIDEDTDSVAVFNGCIYNHHELRDELRRAGHRFRSVSDTEVLIKAYREWGEDFVDHLIGMFAIVLHDRRNGRTVLVRDRLGIKPLYISQTSQRLRFASSLAALVAAGDLDTSLDPVGLHHYLTWHSIVPAPHTVLAGVRKLPPATIRIVEADGRIRDRTYWRPVFERGVRAVWSPDEWRERMVDALRLAVKRRLVADIPVGVLLSGGLDSSLIVALLAESGPDDLATFSIGFDASGGRDGDEFRWSDQVAQLFGTDHHRIHVPTDDVVGAVEGAVSAMAEPMGSHDVVAFYLLSEQVKKQITVVQSGQGADEVFAGYRYHQPIADAPRDGAAAAFAESFAEMTDAEVRRILCPDLHCPTDASSDLVRTAVAEPGAETALDAVLRLELTHLMPDDPVKRVDNMTMAWGVEARVPFLDHELVELAASCPPELKLAQGGKGLLKDAARSFLPPELIDRPKGYFPVPAVSEVDGDLLRHVVDVLRSPTAKQRAVIEPGYLDAQVAAADRHASGGARQRLWQLGLLEMWLQTLGIA